MIGKNLKKNNSGIALLISVLVSSIFFVIAAAVFKIALIEFILSATGKESQFAFYAADTGAECALYWDSKYPVVSGDNSGSAFSAYNNGNAEGSGDPAHGNAYLISRGSQQVFECLNQPVTGFCSNQTGCEAQAHQAYFKIDQPGTCTEVVISKLRSDNSPAVGIPPEKTEILSRGYNTCNTNSPRRVERTLKVTIQ